MCVACGDGWGLGWLGSEMGDEGRSEGEVRGGRGRSWRADVGDGREEIVEAEAEFFFTLLP